MLCSLAPALDVMEQAWPEGEEHMAKLVDDRAHGTRQQQGAHAAQQQQRAGRDGTDTKQVFYVAKPVRVGLHHHPLNPQQRDAAPHPRLRARLRGTHPTRTEAPTKVHQAGENGLRGAAGHAAQVPRQPGAARPQHVPRWQAQIPPRRRRSRCEASTRSLLLTGLPGTRKTHLARIIVTKLRERGKVVHLISKAHSAVQNLGAGAKTADHWVRKYVRGASAWTGCWWKRSRSSTWVCGRTSRACP